MERKIRIFRYDPARGGPGRFDSFKLDIPNETAATILDVLLRLQQEQDPTLAFRYACRVNMCGSCGLVINGREALACKTNVSQIAPGREITLRPLNHFPVIKDLVVDMGPFFQKYEAALPFYEPREEYAEPARVRPDARERREIGGATECITCGCCVSSCTMVRYHGEYAGPAALNRAFTLLADSRDGLFHQRLARVAESCYYCRTEFNCTEVCPKSISPTRAIKHIQRLALKEPQSPPSRRRDRQGAHPEALADARASESESRPSPRRDREGALALDRRTLLRQAGVGLIGAGACAAVAAVGAGVVIGPALPKTAKQWIAVAALDALPSGAVTATRMHYQVQRGFYTEQVSVPVLISRAGDELVCFKASCPHLGCLVRWEALSGRFRCACHGGSFDRQGQVLDGPPPRPLDRYAFKVESGRLFVEVD